MNEALSRWRSFSSDVPPDPAERPPEDDRRRGAGRLRGVASQPRLVAAAALAVLGAAGVGVALVLATVALLDTPGAGSTVVVGEPIDELSVAGSRLGASAQAVGPDIDAAEIVVDVGGAVAQPGLQRLREGDRVGDAIAAAGGFGPRVDISAAGTTLNLAATLTDGDKVVVPELGAGGTQDASDGNAPGDGRIDLNSADQAALESLPGIGPITASRIMEAREQQPFTAVDELLEREVVGESVFEDIRDLVSAGS